MWSWGRGARSTAQGGWELKAAMRQKFSIKAGAGEADSHAAPHDGVCQHIVMPIRDRYNSHHERPSFCTKS